MRPPHPTNKATSYFSLIFALIVVLSCCYFLFSPLGFVPVPWSDAAPFFLPWRDLMQWPPLWRMHNQAAFVPYYDEVNFNTLPALTLVLGTGDALGLTKVLSPTIAFKLISLLALMGWAWGLWSWLRQGHSYRSNWLVPMVLGMAALWDPTVRWSTVVIRPEAWVGLIWLVILKAFWRAQQKSEPLSSNFFWTISGGLATAAYFHFDAIVLVPGVVGALMPSRGTHFFKIWLKRLIAIGTRTLGFLSPWLIYCVWHLPLFLKQMSTQFARLAIPNWGFEHGFFNLLFIEMGSPVKLPAFFKISKVLLWFLIVTLTVRLFFTVFVTGLPRSDRDKRQVVLPTISLELGAGLAFWASFYLWYSKPEAWFVGICHFLFWPWLALTLLSLQEKLGSNTKMKRALVLMAGGFALVSVSASIVQSKQMHPSYRWPVFEEWVDCIDSGIQSHVHHDHPKIWQTHLPDVLVDLAVRHPEYDLTRTLDFYDLKDRAWQFAQTTDAIILSLDLNEPKNESQPEAFTRYFGPPRPEDIPRYGAAHFGKRILEEFSPAQWDMKICHYGDFWASVVSRK